VPQLGQTVPINVSIAPLVVSWSPPADGARISGQFVLTSLTLHVGGTAVPGDSGVTLQQTLDFQEDQLRVVETSRDGEVRFRGAYEVRGGQLLRTDSCHSKDAGGTEAAQIRIEPDRLTLVTNSGSGENARNVVSTYDRLNRDQ
jgi:hypothetical protein